MALRTKMAIFWRKKIRIVTLTRRESGDFLTLMCNKVLKDIAHPSSVL